jgi:hypothetical protein
MSFPIPKVARVIKVNYNPDGLQYQIFLTEDDRVAFVYTFRTPSNIGTVVPWHKVPWPIRDLVEQQLDPHHF